MDAVAVAFVVAVAVAFVVVVVAAIAVASVAVVGTFVNAAESVAVVELLNWEIYFRNHDRHMKLMQ